MVFPLGIKMRFVHDYRLLTNSQAKAKADCLHAHQERFLAQMETCTTWEIETLDLEDHSMEATLRQLIMNIPDPVNSKSWLFYSVNKMFIKLEYILRFHPSGRTLHLYQRTLARGGQCFKIQYFFTDMAIDRSKDVQ